MTVPATPTRFVLNRGLVVADVPGGTPTVDYLRRHAHLSGTKVGCREGDCGACLVLLGELAEEDLRYHPVTSCLLPVAALEGRHLVTVEGLNGDGLNLVQQAIVDEGAVQCGFCTPGIVVALTGFLLSSPELVAGDAIAAVEGNICRCTGYVSIRRVVDRLVEALATRLDPHEERLPALIREGFLPAYFGRIRDQLQAVHSTPAAPVRSQPQVVVAGGTDLYVQRPLAMAEAELFLLARAGLSGIWDDQEHLYVGATTTVEELRCSAQVRQQIPGLERFTRLVSSQPIRHLATVGGNLVNASPIGDLTIMLLALDAEVGLGLDDVTRVVPLRAFFLGYKELDLQPPELVRWVRFRRHEAGHRFNFEKVSKRAHLDIASVNSAVSLVEEGGILTNVNLAAGGVAPVPLYLAAASRYLVGREPSAANVRQAATVAATEIAPISDVRGSAEYKRLLLRQLIYAHFDVLFGLGEQVS